MGSEVPLLPDPRASMPDLGCAGAYQPLFVDSGTSALALALGFARHRNARAGERALMPAYGCPDLVAAAVHAGVQPRLVDLEPDTPWLSLEAVRREIEAVSALVAVNFLGMPERLDALGEIARAAGVPLIEDSAQMAPFSAATQPRGDLVVYSFGRGKPLSLLGGGALLVRNDWADEFRRWLPARLDAPGSALTWMLKCGAYRLATHPGVFVWARRLPFLKLGQVAYAALERVGAMPVAAQDRLASGFARLPRQPSPAQRALHDVLESRPRHMVNLPARLGAGHFPLLRYPVLAPDLHARERLVTRLDRAGLGASAFYVRALAEIPGLPPLAHAPSPEAARFASRLFTLPVHAGVRLRDVQAMDSLLD